eukprot:CAMPEP_0174232712 /NCGR_PEP_ID=MMETSP0417-20130205/2930_1 /TAXON_ID=242541 /ORGANISM="Mayorella sp, Strain BSH-02190019" /LENGTH=963 /DNA_ID=CAMNT_0015310809 /DNA_START=145 /DNA_END=3036 /DNA_ORIENTATION=-
MSRFPGYPNPTRAPATQLDASFPADALLPSSLFEAVEPLQFRVPAYDPSHYAASVLHVPSKLAHSDAKTHTHTPYSAASSSAAHASAGAPSSSPYSSSSAASSAPYAAGPAGSSSTATSGHHDDDDDDDSPSAWVPFETTPAAVPEYMDSRTVNTPTAGHTDAVGASASVNSKGVSTGEKPDQPVSERALAAVRAQTELETKARVEKELSERYNTEISRLQHTQQEQIDRLVAERLQQQQEALRKEQEQLARERERIREEAEARNREAKRRMQEQAMEAAKREAAAQTRVQQAEEQARQQSQREQMLQQQLAAERAQYQQWEAQARQRHEEEERIRRMQQEQQLNARLAQMRAAEAASLKKQFEQQYHAELAHREQLFEQELHAQKQSLEANLRRSMQFSSTAVVPSSSSASGAHAGAAAAVRPSWEVDPGDVHLVEKIGSGAFGEVFRAKLHGKDVAVKKLLLQSLDEHALNDFRQEIQITSNLHHPNIVLFMGACTRPGDLFIVTALAERGSLEDVLFRSGRCNLSFKKRLHMAKEAALGMNWLHSLKPPFLHRDLKTSNLLVDADYHVSVADFGLSTIKTKDHEGNTVNGPVGSPFYMAPEVLLGGTHLEPADVYSFAIVLWELITNKEVYDGEFDSFERVIQCVGREAYRPPLEAWFPAGLQQLLAKCWHADPKQRLTFSQVINQNWTDHIIVDHVLGDSPAATMWRERFFERDAIPWKDFVQGFSKQFTVPMATLSLHDTKGRVLHSSLTRLTEAAPEDRFVTMEAVGELFRWYSPLPTHGAGLALLNKLAEECSFEWFHGSISEMEAVDRLMAHKRKGAWLLRRDHLDTARRLRLYVLSVYHKSGRVQHHGFCYQQATKSYLLLATEFRSLDELVNDRKLRRKLKLGKPLPCPRASYILGQSSSSPDDSQPVAPALTKVGSNPAVERTAHQQAQPSGSNTATGAGHMSPPPSLPTRF